MPDRFDDPSGVNDEWFASDDSSDVESSISRRWLLRLSWLLFFFMGAIAFHLTASPAVGSAVFCLKFLAKDAAVAIWVFRRDPDLFRGVAGGLIYGSLGLLKMSVAALVLGIVLQCATQPGAQPVQWIESLLISGGISFVLMIVTMFMALVFSAVAGRPLWLSNGMFRELCDGHWPPRPECRQNAIADLATLSIGLPAFLASIGLTLFVLVTVPQPLLAFCLAGLIVVGLMGGAFVSREIVILRIAAQSPADCWPDEPEDLLAYDDFGPQSFLDPNHAD